LLPRRTKEFVIIPTSFQLAGMAQSRWPGFYQITIDEQVIGDLRHVSTTMYLPPLPGDVGTGEVVSLVPGELDRLLKIAASGAARR
jgi:hypothetical protein